jgi:acyl dehydratase
MAAPVLAHYHRQPSALAYMARALLPSATRQASEPLPPVAATWSGVRLATRHQETFRKATGLDGLSVLYPHVLGFRLQMAVLTSRAFPLPIWNALQVRNRLTLHRPLAPQASYDFEARVAAQRPTEKGLEVDLVTRLMRDGACDWESSITYFYRGRPGADAAVAPPPSPDLSDAAVVARQQMPTTGRLAFARLTGDYNGIHFWDAYAHRFGFPAAFLHPQRVAALCMARLCRGGLAPPSAEAQRLDLWLKGPVFYAADTVLSATREEASIRFGIALAGEVRTAIAGLWRAGAADA